ncbi:YsnF/AvaK domain-containing protein [Metabacillus fastidiosus]|uniref:YsnF/AvaK domain-containing protein n=1 Tax=Metabacillus fastidiosus TaxID=1458 RepID=UPI002DBAD58B|nr:YsnF/AvaK domain-containing protein [Metabacillus fastidiosus]MEC2078072.1 YsnF/AvaK domain-containing protein [Metabacillus fastidiosus]
MGKYIIIGVIIGSIVAWITGFTVLGGIVLGAIIGGINYAMMTRKNINKTPKKTKDSKEQTLQLREEQLNIKKERIQTGEVKVHKEVVEEQKTFTVPIKREEMVIEAGDEEEFRIPLKEEEIQINKHPVQLNEVSITTRQIQEMKQIKEKLKKETADVEVAGEADVIKKLSSEKKD